MAKYTNFLEREKDDYLNFNYLIIYLLFIIIYV